MHNTPLVLLAALWFAASVPAQNQPAAAPVTEFKKIAGPMELKEGDTVVFLGDSITHQCLYTQYVEDYFYTRFPNKRLRFHNAGVGGDRASSALARFDEDVASFKPKYVTILLGMNDGSYRDFDKAIFDTYQQDMTKLLASRDITLADLNIKDLKLADFSASSLHIESCILDHVNLASAALASLKLKDVRFVNCSSNSCRRS